MGEALLLILGTKVCCEVGVLGSAVQDRRAV